MIRSVIIDDEPESRTAVSNILTNYCEDVEILGEAGDVASGIQLIRQTQPDVVFLDIQMPDGTGFKLLESFDDIQFQVIFITAFDQYAIKAIKFSAIDYILKPVDPQQIIKAVQKLRKMSPEKNQYSERIGMLLENKQKVTKIALPTQNGYRLVRIGDIIRCEADNNYTNFYLRTTEKFLVTRTLKDYELMLDHDSFMRVHQSHLINLNFVEQYIKGDGGIAIMSDGSEVEISRRKKDTFLNHIL
jgi:two-component system LytT family response regulator